MILAGVRGLAVAVPTAILSLVIIGIGAAASRPAAGQGASRGTIKGRVRITGKIPGNSIIRMAADPMCSKINAGKRVVQDAVASTIEGHLANVFVVVEGTFPQAPPAPSTRVVIDQRACLYVPRMVGVRVGQTVEVKNSDDLLHNIHTSSSRGNELNISQPKAGMTNQFRFKEERMLKLRCDVHGWMTSWIGVVDHPYFAVTAADGTFEIRDVPAGSRSVEIWHEQLGPVKKNVQVKAGAPATVDFEYSGSEKPASLKRR
jgi:plastocyanin